MINWFKRKKKITDDPREESAGRTEEQAQPPVPEPEEDGQEAAREAPAAIPAGPAPPEEPPAPIEVETDRVVPPGAERETIARTEEENEEPEAEPEEAPEEEDRLQPIGPDGEGNGAQGKGRFFKRLRERLHKTREQFVTRIDRLVLGKKKIDLDLMDDLEEVLITSDLGVRTTQVLLDKVAQKIKRQELSDPEKLRDQLREEIASILSVPARAWDPRSARPFVIMVIGVNGVGKTTTIGKLAHQMKDEGLKVLLVAGDTFRAAAVEQLSLWGERAGVPVVKQKSGSDPSAVAFDAMDAAAARDMDVVLIDTAGRMHTKVNLMEELKKVHRVVNRKNPDAPHEILLVLDASTGQNALSQAKLFKEEMGVTGLILTKLDGTAKGGIIVAISEELQLPVRFIGIGESIDDLRPFDPEEFTKALF